MNKKEIIILTGITFVSIIILYKVYKKYKEMQNEIKNLKSNSDKNARGLLNNLVGLNENESILKNMGKDENNKDILNGSNNITTWMKQLNPLASNSQIHQLLPPNVSEILSGNPNSHLAQMTEKLNTNIKVLENLQNSQKQNSQNSITVEMNSNSSSFNNQNMQELKKIHETSNDQEVCSEISENSNIEINDENENLVNNSLPVPVSITEHSGSVLVCSGESCSINK